LHEFQCGKYGLLFSWRIGSAEGLVHAFIREVTFIEDIGPDPIQCNPDLLVEILFSKKAKKLDIFFSETCDSTESIMCIGSGIAVIGARYSQHDHLAKARRNSSPKIHPDQVGSIGEQFNQIVQEMDGVFEFALHKLARSIEFILFVE
jgi:hypothetical protein